MNKPRLNLLYASLSFCGFWPPDGSEKSYTIKMKLSLIVYAYQVFGVISYFVDIVPDSSVSGAEKLEALFVAVGLLQMLTNCAALFNQRYKIKQLYINLENFDNYGVPENIKTISFLTNSMAAFFVGYCIIGGFIVVLYPVYDYENCMWKAELSNKTILCGFGTKVSYPYNIQEGFGYFIHVGIELFTICFSCSGGSIIVNCTLGAFEFIILRIHQLKDMLDEVFKTEDEVEHKKRFRECVIFHIYIIELVKITNECFVPVTFPALLYYSVVIGTTLMAFLTGHSLISFLNLWGWGFGVYIMCVNGQRIHDYSLSIANKVYSIEWYRGDPKLWRDVSIVLCRAQKPLKYECGILGDFHFVTFNNIMSTGYKFSTLKTGVGN